MQPCDCRDGICDFPAQCRERNPWLDVPGPVRTRTGIVIGSRWPGYPAVRDHGASADTIQDALLGEPEGHYVSPFWSAVDRACWWAVCLVGAGSVGACVFGWTL